jgi:hypothetical protein
LADAPTGAYLGKASEATLADLCDNTLVPLRAVADWLSAPVTADAKTLEYTVKLGDRSMTVAAGNRVIRMGGPKPEDVVHFLPPVLIKNALYVPVAEVAKALDATVTWRKERGTPAHVLLTHPKAAKPLALALTDMAAPSPRAASSYALFTGSYLVGGLDRGKWLSAQDMRPLLPTSTKCKLYSLTGAAGEADAMPEKPGSAFGNPVTLKGGPKKTDGLLGLSATAPWNVQPRIATAVAVAVDHPVYVAVVRDFLQAHGMAGAKVILTQVLKIDLGGDGVEETLISASSADAGTGHTEKAGNYSVVLLRRNNGGVVTTHVITGAWFPRDASAPYAEKFRITGLLDLDSDGTLEIIVRAGFHEGESTRVYRTSKGDVFWLLEGDLGV